MELKQEDPGRNIYILFRDIRSYGQREDLYKKARELGVIFINYEMHTKPNVIVKDDKISVIVWDHVLHQPISIKADVVTLATAIIPNPDVQQIAKIYKLPTNADGFFQEAHSKLRPVDFASDGLFLAGVSHYPKPIEESIAQAQAAVARAATVLSRRRIELDSIKASVTETCDGCALCLDVCPYHAISLVAVAESTTKQIKVNAAKCKGCGVCQATCPKEGVAVGGFSYRQISAQIEAALS